MLAISTTETLRRLPIICIEDVCLMSSFPILVWLMMCDKEYELKRVDVFIVINIVISLCETDEVFIDREDRAEYLGGHNELRSSSEVLALYYRSKYGGMKGDMAMLRRAIQYYYFEGGKILETKWTDRVRFSHKVHIMPESADFHPYPNLLWDISKKTAIQKDLIKMSIWFAESGMNVRKPETIRRSDEAKNAAIWPIIKVELDDWRVRNIQ